MADKISDVFNANPSAGNDPTKDFSTPVDFDEGTQEAYSNEQIANMVAYQLGIPENLPDQATFSARFPDNSLVATVDALQTSYTYYVVNTTGTTPTGGGSTGAIGFTAADWDSHTYYLFISDNDSTYTQVEPGVNDPNNDLLAVPGLVLQANDTLEPTTPTQAWTLTTGTDPTTDISVTLPVFADTGSGIDQVDLWHYDIAGNYTLYRSDVGNAGAAMNLTGNGPGQALDLLPIAIDNAGNTQELPHKVVTLDDAASGTVGFTASVFTVEGNNKVVEINEDGTGTQTVSLTCYGAHAAFDVDISTVDGTAIAGEEFTALSGQTVSFGVSGSDETQTQALTINNLTSSENNMFGIVIDTVQTGLGSVVVGSDNGVNFRILGSGGGSVGYQQDNTSDELLVIDVKNMTNHIEPASGDNLNTQSSTRALTGSKIKSNNLSATYGSTTARGDGSATVSGSTVPYRQTDVVWNSTGTMYFWLRMWHNTTAGNNNIHLAISNDGTGNTGLLNVDSDAPSPGTLNNRYKWISTDETASNRITASVTAGADTLEICTYRPGVSVDRLVATSQSGYDPNFSGETDALGLDKGVPDDAFYGPPESTQEASGDPIDNPLNATVPPAPASGGGSITMTLSPTDNFSSAPVNVNPIISYPLGSEITNSTFEVKADAAIVSGFISINAAGTEARFIPDAPFDNSAADIAITIVAEGTVRDENGVVKDYATTITSWNFTIPRSPVIPGGDYIWEENFNDLPVGTKWSEVVVNRLTLQSCSMQSSTIGSKCLIFNDPLGDPSRSKVMGVYQPAGSTGTSGGGEIGVGLCEMQIVLPDSYSTLYFAYDWMQMDNDPNTGFPTEWKILTKMPGLAGSNPTNFLAQASGGNQPIGVVGSTSPCWSARCQRMRFGSPGDWKMNHVGYLYAADPDQDPTTDTGHGATDEYYNQKVVWAYNDSSDTSSGKFEMLRNTWNTVECKVQMNTARVASGSPNTTLPSTEAGVFEIYINGVKRGGRTGVPWRVDNILANMVFFATGYGGNKSNSIYWPNNPQYTYYDNLRVSEDPITF